MDDKALELLLQDPQAASEEDLQKMMRELRMRLDALNESICISEDMKKCRKRYEELLKIAGEINGIFHGE